MLYQYSRTMSFKSISMTDTHIPYLMEWMECSKYLSIIKYDLFDSTFLVFLNIGDTWKARERGTLEKRVAVVRAKMVCEQR